MTPDPAIQTALDLQNVGRVTRAGVALSRALSDHLHAGNRDAAERLIKQVAAMPLHENAMIGFVTYARMVMPESAAYIALRDRESVAA